MNRIKPLGSKLIWCLSAFIMAFSACSLPNHVVWNEQTHCIRSRNNIRYITISTSGNEYSLKVLDRKMVCLDQPVVTYTSEASYYEDKNLKHLPEDKTILDLLKPGQEVELQIHSGFDQPAFKVHWVYNK